MKTAAQILEIGANGAVVQLPERRFPGIVVQGDSLSNLVASFAELKDNLALGNQSEIAATLETIEDDLNGRLSFYESVLAKNGIDLPYVKNQNRG